MRVLGPLEVVGEDGAAVHVGGLRRQRLLANLAVAASTPDPSLAVAGLLSLVVHGSGSVGHAPRLLDVHLSGLSDLLGRDRLLLAEHAVTLDVRAGELDAAAFDDEAEAGLAALRDGDIDAARELLRSALALWRSDTVAEGLELLPPVSAVAERLEERRCEAAAALASLEGSSNIHRTSARTGSRLPTGAVSFLLTDIVGSTKRWEDSPRAMTAALERHDNIVADAVHSGGGVLLKHRGEGDSTFSVFADAHAALAAAVAAQRALAAETWPSGADIRVRMALHTGAAIERANDYYGPTVNRVARLRGIAGPGQVLLTRATATLVREQLPDGVSLAPLGARELRDLRTSEHVFLVVDAALPPPAPDPHELADGETEWRQIPSRLLPPATPFAGRVKEQRALQDMLTAVRAAGTGRVALVSGEAGIGKTRLAAEVATSASRAGFAVAYGRCDEALGLPNQALAAALGDLVDSLPGGLVESYVRHFGGELARLVPGILRRVPTVPAPREAAPDTERHLLYDAVRGLLGTVSELAPLLLVVDDIHWADRPTLQLLRFLTAELRGVPVMLLLTMRDGEGSDSHPLSDFLAHVRSLEHADATPLTGLTGDEVAELVNSLTAAHSPVADELARRLNEETDGNPLFVVELVRHLTESGAAVSAHAELDLPATVVDVIDRRVKRLGPTPARVLVMAGVAGREFDLDVLSAALGLEEEEVLSALEEAERAQLVIEAGKPGSFLFTHALIGRTLEQGLTATRRARSHGQLADAISTLYGEDAGDHVAALATHLRHAGRAVDPNRVARAAWLAGDQALAQLAPDEAVDWYEAALQHLATHDIQRVDLLIALGSAQQQAGIPDYRRTLLDSAAMAKSAGDGDRLMAAALANTRGDRSRTYMIDTERVATLEAAVDAHRRRGDSSDLARALALLALETAHDPDWRQRMARSDEAVAMARRVGDAATLADVLRLRFETIRLPDTLGARAKETAELRSLAHQLDDPFQLAYAYCWRSRVALESGDVDELDRCWEMAVEYSDRTRNPYLQWNLAAHRVSRAIMQGDLAAAERLAFECLAVADAAGEPDGRVILGDHLFVIRDAQDRLGEIEPGIRSGIERYPRVRGLHGCLSYICSELGRIDEARDLLADDAADGFARYTRDMAWFAFVSYAGRAAANARDEVAARALLPLLTPWSDQVVWSGATAYGPIAYVTGRLADVVGDTDAALTDLRAAATIALRMRAPLWLARNRVAEARVLLRRDAPGDGPAARAALAEAAELAERHGFASVAREAAAAIQEGAVDG